MKKFILLIIAMLTITGCSSNTKSSEDDYTISFYIDSKTCVEYVKYGAGHGKGITIR